MNRVYLFGKVVSKSKLKYSIEPKLSIYVKLSIKIISGNIFKCIVNEKNLNETINITSLDYVYITGYGIINNELLNIIVSEIYKYI